MAELSLIVARARTGVIGANGTMPWHLPEDLAFFKKTTLGSPVIMGRKTYESIGRPLPKRTNIVLTRSSTWSVPGVTVVHTLDEALAVAEGAERIFVIGGAQLYREALHRVETAYVTEIEADFEGDAFFVIPDPENWTRTVIETLPATETRPTLTFTRLERQVNLTTE